MKAKDFNYYSGKKYDGMMGRCYRERDASYKNYGGRGIKVCTKWVTDINEFRVWLLSQLDNLEVSLEEFVSNSRKYQLDRIDVEGHYTPDNCRLVSPQKNTRNRRCRVVRNITTAEGDVICLS
jgi:hypothetical protein